MHRFSIILPAALLIGCVVTDNYDSSRQGHNPFDESSSPSYEAERLPAPIVSRSHIPATHVVKNEISSSPVRHDSDKAIQISPLLDPPAVSSSDLREASKKFPAVTYDMMAEARRLKALGDYHGSSQLLEQAGYSGNPEAFYELSRMHQDGTLYKDDEAMLRYITQAHDLGHSEATRVLGHLYLLGMVVPKDPDYGQRLLRKASEESLRAAREYGEMLSDLRSPHLSDIELGIEYLERAVHGGHQAAIPSLVRAYEAVGRLDDSLVIKADMLGRDSQETESFSPEPPLKQHSDLDRALLLGPQATYDHALQILIRKVNDADPEFTGYCLMAVAGSQGYEPAIKELRHLDGIRTSMARTHPGKIDTCIAEFSHRAGLADTHDYE